MTQPTAVDPKLTIEWLNKFIMMAQWDKALPFQVVTLLSDQAAYQEFRKRVPTGGTKKTDQTDVNVQSTPVTVAREKLSQAVAGWPSLQELFAAEVDPFAGAPAQQLQLLAEVSDMTTDAQKMVYSRNGTFVAVIEALRQTQELDTEPLLVDWLHKFLTLFETKQAIAEMLYDLAESPHWLVVMASLRDGRDYTRDEEASVGQTLLTWQGKLTTELRSLLFKPGHLSRAPTQLIRMAWNNSQLFQEARESIPVDQREKDPLEERRQVANEALLLFEQKAQLDCGEIKADLMVLATVARHYINVRKFAKLDGFVYTWPEIARVAMSNYVALEYVEDLLVNRKPRPADSELDTREARELYEMCAANDRLIRFLRLRPRFAEIDEDELRRYRPLAPVVITETVEAPSGGSSLPDFAVQPTASPTAIPIANIYLEITKLEDGRLVDAPATAYQVAFTKRNFDVVVRRIEVSVEQLWEEMRSSMGVATDNDLPSVLKEAFASSPIAAEERITQGGNLLQERILSDDMEGQIVTTLSQKESLRLIVRSPEKEVHYLPWEWLWVAYPPQLLLRSPNCSIVRQYLPPRSILAETTTSAIVAPLKLLSILPPAPKGRRFSSDHTIRALNNIAIAHPVEHSILAQESATLRNIKEQLDQFKPQFVHFEGHIISDSEPDDDKRKDFFVLANQPILVEEFGQMLKEYGVQLLMIGRSEMRSVYRNVGVQVTLKLSQRALPLVIAPMRAIDDASATTFTAEFYDAFLQGNTLEAALYQARNRLASKGGDWSVFALFAETARLDYFRFLRDMA